MTKKIDNVLKWIIMESLSESEEERDTIRRPPSFLSLKEQTKLKNGRNPRE